MQYSIGQYVKANNPSFGICQVVAEGNSEDVLSICNLKDKMITIRTLSIGMLVLLKEEDIRVLSTKEELQNELNNYANIVILDQDKRKTWNQKYHRITELLKGNLTANSLYVYKMIVTQNKTLSFGEKKMIDQVLSFLAQEYALLFDTEINQARKILKEQLSIK